MTEKTMSSEICKLCDKDSTPWFNINGHICQDCYLNSKGSEWISVKDKLPEKTLSVLIYNGSFIDIGAYFSDNFFTTETGGVLDVTHWMPLPDSPK